LALSLVGLLVLLLALNLLSAVGVGKSAGIGLSIVWMTAISVGAPVVLYQRKCEEQELRRRSSEWEADPRRLSIDCLGLDLAAGRVPAGIKAEDIHALEGTTTDWRHGREALESLSWATGELALLRESLLVRMDEAMANLLGEAGSGSSLGISPFALERARTLFLEIGREANQIASSHANVPKFPTDDTIEAMRPELEQLRTIRIGGLREETIPSPVTLKEETA